MTISEVIFLAIFWTWLFSAILFLRNTFLPRLPVVQPGLVGLSFEQVDFHSTDDVSLKGWVIPHLPTSLWVILCHGLGTNRSDLLDIATNLHEAGFNLFLFDFRGHGESAGATSSFGWKEQRDLEGALVYLGQHQAISRPCGVYGISMGAAVAIMVAARDERIGAVAVESPYPNLEETLGRHLVMMYPLPKQPFLWFVAFTYKIRFGVWPGDVAPEESVNRLDPRPILLIQGAEDKRMPLEGTKRIYEKAGGSKQLWVIEGAGHLESFSQNPVVYMERLIHFFQSSLN